MNFFILLLLSSMSFAAPTTPSPRQEELAALRLQQKGISSFSGKAWPIITDQEREQIAELEIAEIKSLEELNRLESDLAALLASEKLSVSLAASQKFRYSTKTKNEMIQRILTFTQSVLYKNSKLDVQLHALANMQITPDPRAKNLDLSDTSMQAPTQGDLLKRLAEVFLFGLRQATEQRLSGDFEGAKRSSAGAMRALVEAYLVAGKTSGNQGDFLQTAMWSNFVSAIVLTGFALGNLSFTDQTLNMEFKIFETLAIIEFVASFWNGIDRQKFSTEFPPSVTIDSEKRVSQPLFLPPFLRNRLIRRNAYAALKTFWTHVKIQAIEDVGRPSTRPEISSRLKRLADLKDIGKLEQWAIVGLFIANPIPFNHLAEAACENALTQSPP